MAGLHDSDGRETPGASGGVYAAHHHRMELKERSKTIARVIIHVVTMRPQPSCDRSDNAVIH